MKVRDVIDHVSHGFPHYLKTCNLRGDVIFHAECIVENVTSIAAGLALLIAHGILIVLLPIWWIPVRYWIYRSFKHQIELLRAKEKGRVKP